jgi:hypothetical protein
MDGITSNSSPTGELPPNRCFTHGGGDGIQANEAETRAAPVGLAHQRDKPITRQVAFLTNAGAFLNTPAASVSLAAPSQSVRSQRRGGFDGRSRPWRQRGKAEDRSHRPE